MTLHKHFLRVSFLLSLFFLVVPFAQASFTDVDSRTLYKESIESLQESGVLTGYPDGTFRPYSPINRAEFTKLIGARNINWGWVANCDTSKLPFTDIQKDSWYAPYLCATYFFEPVQIIEGYPNGTFQPEQHINFVEAAKILALSSMEDREDVEELYTDFDATWFDKYIYWLEDKGAIPSSIYGFDHTMTRGQMAEILHRLNTNDTTQVSLRYSDIDDSLSKTSHWETYKNEQYGFYFQYPQNWRMSVNLDSAYIAGKWYTEQQGISAFLCLPPDGCQDSSIRISAVKNTDVETILSLLTKSNTIGRSFVTSNVLFAGETATMYTHLSEYGSWKEIIFKRNDIVYTIGGDPTLGNHVFESLSASFRTITPSGQFYLSSDNEKQVVNQENTGGCGEVETGNTYYSGLFWAWIDGRGVPLNIRQGTQVEMRFGEGTSWDKVIHTYTITDPNSKTGSLLLGVTTQYETCNNNEIYLVGYNPDSEFLAQIPFSYTNGMPRTAQEFGVENGNFYTVVYDNSTAEYYKTIWSFDAGQWSLIPTRLQSKAFDSSTWVDIPME